MEKNLRAPGSLLRLMTVCGAATILAGGSALAKPGGLDAMPYDACRTVVEGLVSQRYDREVGPISDYLQAVTDQAARDAMDFFFGTSRELSALPGCPKGYHSGTWLIGQDCSLDHHPAGDSPNVDFAPVSEREVERLGDSSVRVCVRARWLVFSLGQSQQEVCVRFGAVAGKVHYFDRTDHLGPAMDYAQDLHGDAAGDTQVDGEPVPLSRQAFLARKVWRACGDEPTNPADQVCEQPGH